MRNVSRPSIVIGVCGGTGSGKTTLCKKITEKSGLSVAMLSQDIYYRDFSHLPLSKRNQLNFDHPQALDNKLFNAHIKKLKKGNSINIPEYDFVTHTRIERMNRLDPRECLLVEGILLLSDSQTRKLFDYTVFIDLDADVRFIRRLNRDRMERGRSVESIVKQYLSTVKPMHDQYVKPQKKQADLIISGKDIDKGAEIIRFITRNNLSSLSK
jgi:uridine kinase